MTSKVVPLSVAVNLALMLSFLIMGCASSSSSDEPGLLEQAQAAKEAQRLDEARPLAEQALEEEYREGETKRILAEIHRRMAAEKLSQGDAAGAHASFLDAADIEPTTRLRGSDLIAAFDAGQQAGLADDQLLELALRAIEHIPHDPELRRHAARLAEDLGDDHTAAVHYQWIVSALPDDEGAAFRLGIVYLAIDRPADAAAVLDRVYREDPENIQAALNLAEAYAESDRFYAAQELMELLLDQFPDHPAVLRQYADLEERHGDRHRARQLRQRAIDATPGIEEREMRPLR